MYMYIYLYPLHLHLYFSEQTGEPCKSFPPWPPQHAPGGGAVIPCSYRIQVNGRHEEIFKNISSVIQVMEEKTVLEINMY